MKKKVFKSVIGILIVIEGVFLFLSYKSYNNIDKAKVLEDVKLADILKDKKKSLAIQVQDSNYQWQDQGTTTGWPDSNHYYYGTKCTDETGKETANTKQIVQFDDTTNTATITTKETVYCTIYFAYKKDALSLMQATTDGNHLKTISGDDKLIRYIGKYSEITKNYVCFGTSNIEDCKKDKDKYMYRIIGIQAQDDDTVELKQNQLKIIKATPKINNSIKTIAWSENYSTDINWDNTNNTVRKYLNDGTSGFLKTINDMGGSWSNLISDPKWYIGDDTTATTATGISSEKNKQTTNKYKVGLMYASDYYNSWTYTSNTESWLHIIHGTSSSSSAYSSTYEWTMTRYGYNSDYTAWGVNTSGSLRFDGVYWTTPAVRPVFYLSSNIKLSGSGTESSPFIITFTR